MHPKTGRINTEVHARTATYTSVEKRITAQFRCYNSNVDMPVHLFLNCNVFLYCGENVSCTGTIFHN